MGRSRLLLLALFGLGHAVLGVWLLVGAGVLLFVDSRTTNVLIDAPDPAFDVTREIDDTPDGWRRYVGEGGDPEKARIELDRLHGRARAHLSEAGAPRPDGLDPLLAVARARIDARAHLEAAPLVVDHDSLAALGAQVAAIPGATLVPIEDALRDRASSCAAGLSSAFEAATGSKTLVVETPNAFDADATPDAPRIAMTWSARAGERLYGGPGDRYLFPGLVLTASLRWEADNETIAALETDGDPGPRFEFTTYAPTFPFGGEPDASGIVGAMIEAGCADLGRRWIEDLTGLSPTVGHPGDEVPLADKCRGGEPQACRLAAADLRARDPEAALALLESGCRSMGLFAAENCLAAADLALELAVDPAPGHDVEMARARATIALQTGCDADDGVACTRAAALSLSLLPEPGATTWQEAYHLRLRGCDLGAAQACLDAAEQVMSTTVGRTPSPMRARLLATRACAADLDAGCERAATITGTRESAVHDVVLERGDSVFDVLAIHTTSADSRSNHMPQRTSKTLSPRSSSDSPRRSPWVGPASSTPRRRRRASAHRPTPSRSTGSSTRRPCASAIHGGARCARASAPPGCSAR